MHPVNELWPIYFISEGIIMRFNFLRFLNELDLISFNDFGNDSFRFHITKFYYYIIDMSPNMSDLQFESKINHLEFIFDNLDRYITRKFENENREIKNFRDIYENEVLNLYDEN